MRVQSSFLRAAGIWPVNKQTVLRASHLLMFHVYECPCERVLQDGEKRGRFFGVVEHLFEIATQPLQSALECRFLCGWNRSNGLEREGGGEWGVPLLVLKRSKRWRSMYGNRATLY